MGKISRIVKGIGSGLVSFARTAERTVGDFERVFGKIEGPDKGMASQSEIMERSAAMEKDENGGKSLQDKVALNGGDGGEDNGLPDPGNIGVSNGGKDEDLDYI